MQTYGKVVSGQPYTCLLARITAYRLMLSLISLTTKKDASGRSHVANEPRLRHLYSTYRNFTIGKTYTTFANLSSYPEINDANGPVGHLLVIRQELVRYNASSLIGVRYSLLFGKRRIDIYIDNRRQLTR